MTNKRETSVNYDKSPIMRRQFLMTQKASFGKNALLDAKWRSLLSFFVPLVSRFAFRAIFIQLYRQHLDPQIDNRSGIVCTMY